MRKRFLLYSVLLLIYGGVVFLISFYYGFYYAGKVLLLPPLEKTILADYAVQRAEVLMLQRCMRALSNNEGKDEIIRLFNILKERANQAPLPFLDDNRQRHDYAGKHTRLGRSGD